MATKFLRETCIVVPNLVIEIRDGDGGPIIRQIRTHNLITNSGLDHMRNLIAYPDDAIEAQNSTPRFIAVGTDSTIVASGDTELGTEIFRKEITARSPQTHGIEFHLALSTGEGNGYLLTEAGIFHVAADGTLWARATHAAISKTASVAVAYRWTWTFGVPA